MLLLGVADLPAQTPAATLVASARARLNERQYDDAIALLRMALQPPAGATADERLEVHVLIAIGEFFAGRDSLARRAFRKALGLAPGLEVEGLAELAPELPAMLAAERAALAKPQSDSVPAPREAAAADMSSAPGGPAGELFSCAPACAGVQEPPELRSMPRVQVPDHLQPESGRLLVVMRAIVDTGGRVEPNSVSIISNNAPGMAHDFERALEGARFRAGRVGSHPVRVLVELTFDSRRTQRLLVLGRPSRL